MRGSHPILDPYNETGERRTEIDEEYSRLMNCDQSPYNFLYNVMTYLILSKNRDTSYVGCLLKCTSLSHV